MKNKQYRFKNTKLFYTKYNWLRGMEYDIKVMEWGEMSKLIAFKVFFLIIHFSLATYFNLQ